MFGNGIEAAATAAGGGQGVAVVVIVVTVVAAVVVAVVVAIIKVVAKIVVKVKNKWLEHGYPVASLLVPQRFGHCLQLLCSPISL